MKYQPNKNYKSDDIGMTPPHLAKMLVEHFKPQGKGLEPCCGTGNILRLLNNADWCEITEGRDFFDYHEKVDYIFTNPPWSQIRPFLTHSMELADDIYFLLTVNHLKQEEIDRVTSRENGCRYFKDKDLINRQKAENKKLQDLMVKYNGEFAKQEAEIERLKKFALIRNFDRFEKEIKAEAYKECIEKVKEAAQDISEGGFKGCYLISKVNLDNLLKETEGAEE